MFKLQEEESASIQPSMSVFHVQPASLSQGYETTLPHGKFFFFKNVEIIIEEIM